LAQTLAGFEHVDLLGTSTCVLLDAFRLKRVGDLGEHVEFRSARGNFYEEFS
jgi:hypothetical protein